jgi:hypothetical protein
MARILFATALVLTVTACGTSAGSPASGPATGHLDAEVVRFDPDGSAPGRFAALSDSPVDLRAFAGWYGGATDDEGEPVAAKPDTTYLAVTDSTGCRTPKSVDVRRVKNDLVVTFTGGTDHQECVRAVGPSAVLALRAADVRGVRTVNGGTPLDPAGPGRLVDFVALPPGSFEGIAPAALGQVDAMATQLSGSADAVAALRKPVPDGHFGFAFVRSGCRATGALLLVSHQLLDADVTGGETTRCVAPEYFLATFTIASENVPETAELAPQ